MEQSSVKVKHEQSQLGTEGRRERWQVQKRYVRSVKIDGIVTHHLWCWARLSVGVTPKLGLEGWIGAHQTEKKKTGMLGPCSQYSWKVACADSHTSRVLERVTDMLQTLCRYTWQALILTLLEIRDHTARDVFPLNLNWRTTTKDSQYSEKLVLNSERFR